MTRNEAIKWCDSQLGKALDYDGVYGAQCVDFFNYYYKFLTGGRNPYSDGYGVPGAKDLWNVSNVRFNKIANDPNDQNQVPKEGDIIIYSGNMAGTGGYGHVAVYAGNSTYYEQNYGGMYVKKNTRKFNGYEIGWLSYQGFDKVTPIAVYQGIVKEAVNYRKEPNSKGELIGTFYAGEVLDFKGYVKSETVEGNNIWLVGKHTGGYLWSGAIKALNINNLPDLTPKAPETPPEPVQADLSQQVIDVSAHNDIYYYSTVINSVLGAIAKAGHTGKGYSGTAVNGDPKFATYKDKFGDKLLGAYWYAYCSLDPIAEAKAFVDTVGDVPENFTYWLDIEELDGRTKKGANEWCRIFLSYVERTTDKYCGLYMNRNWFNNYIDETTKGDRYIWLAHYDTPEFSNPVKNQVAHQYTSSGKVKGYSGNLDLNYIKPEFLIPKRPDIIVTSPDVPESPSKIEDMEVEKPIEAPEPNAIQKLIINIINLIRRLFKK